MKEKNCKSGSFTLVSLPFSLPIYKNVILKISFKNDLWLGEGRMLYPSRWPATPASPHQYHQVSFSANILLSVFWNQRNI